VFDNTPFHEIADQKLVPKDENKEDWFTNATGYLDLAVISERRDRYFRERSLYDNIYTKYCRSCHVAQRSLTDWGNALPFNIAAHRRICGDPKEYPIMAHAELTDDRFSNEVHTFVHGDTSTGLEILCDEPPTITPKQISDGESAFAGCRGCHDTVETNLPGKDISCSTHVRNNLGTINSDMNSLTLNGKQVSDITAYLNSFGHCDP
jgi:hypothetical protein